MSSTCLAALTIEQRAVATAVNQADNAKFLEQFRYTIIASQLLSGHSALGQHRSSKQDQAHPDNDEVPVPTSVGIVCTTLGAIAVASLINWVYEGGYSYLTKKRFFFALSLLALAAVLAHAYIRHQWLRYVRESALKEMARFVLQSQDFDGVTSAAVGLIQEVELVSRGYRMLVQQPDIWMKLADKIKEALRSPPSAESKIGAKSADASVCVRRSNSASPMQSTSTARSRPC